MRDHSNHIELSRDEAVSTMLAKLEASGMTSRFKANIERCNVSDAYGRVLAQDIEAKTDIPNALTCCLDSVAVHWSDFENLPEGQLPNTEDWVRGVDWQFANTGVAMPEGFDTAVVIEHVSVSEDEDHIQILSAPSERYAGTRAAGSNMRKGDVVVENGALVTPDVAARIAGAGWSSFDVLARPRVAFIPTGDELVPPNLPISSISPDRYAGIGHVFESNSVVVQGKVEAYGGEYVPFDIVPDERDAIRRALEKAVRVSDVIVLNAGSSKGSDDWSVEVLEKMGEIICHQTNHGPGHHSSYSLLAENGRVVPVVGISGPSGGASFTLDFYLRPIVFALLGQDPYERKVPCRLCEPFAANKFAKRSAHKNLSGENRPPEATEPGSSFYSVKFMEVRPDDSGVLCAKPVSGKAGSPETAHANAIFMLPAGAYDTPPEVGSIIEVEMRFGYRL